MRSRGLRGLVGVALLLTGCATTRMMQMGVLPQGRHLVTLVVTEDRDVVRDECRSVPASGTLLGCHLWHRVTLPDAGEVQLVKIVRYTDALPSPFALEIDVHELCHAIAALQPIADPCHADNGGAIRSAADAPVRWR
jgi:hypothetical protein